jgi:adenylate cyclase
MQAAVIGTVANNVNIQRPDWADGAELLTILLLGLLVIGLSRWIYVGIGFLVVSVAGVAYAGTHLFANYLILFDGFGTALAVVLVGLHAYIVKFVSEYIQKQQIKKQFGTYLSPAMVEKLQKDPSLLKLGGERRELSIMFTDVRGFTTISEHYGDDVEGLTKIMNRYMTAMTRSILDKEGTLDKYIGDAQMAFWNAPVNDPEHARHAVEAALTMLGNLNEFNEEISKEGVPAFGMGIGINTGPVIVGNMGSDQRFDYTCLGDAVNLASRLEGQSKGYGVKLILGPETARQIAHLFSVIELDNIAVKGKTTGVKISTIGDTVQYKHAEYLKEYYRGNWSRATEWAQDLLDDPGVTIKDYYHKMIERMDQGLPADWDGTYRATSK